MGRASLAALRATRRIAVVGASPDRVAAEPRRDAHPDRRRLRLRARQPECDGGARHSAAGRPWRRPSRRPVRWTSWTSSGGPEHTPGCGALRGRGRRAGALAPAGRRVAGRQPRSRSRRVWAWSWTDARPSSCEACAPGTSGAGIGAGRRAGATRLSRPRTEQANEGGSGRSTGSTGSRWPFQSSGDRNAIERTPDGPLSRREDHR